MFLGLFYDICLSGLQMKNSLLANNSGTSTEMFLLMCTVPYQINQRRRKDESWWYWRGDRFEVAAAIVIR